MRQILVLIALVILSAVPAYAQGAPCVPTPTLSIVTPAAEVTAIFTDYATLFGGQPVWTTTDTRAVPKGANVAAVIATAAQSSPRQAWTVKSAPAPANCYGITLGPFLTGAILLPNTEYDLYVRTQGAGGTSGWSNAAPFGRPGPPAVPSALSIP